MSLRTRRPDADPLHDQPPDVREQPWYQFVSELAALRASGDYPWANAWLASIQARVTRTHQVSPSDWRAVARILATERLPSRAFDAFGFGRRW